MMRNTLAFLAAMFTLGRGSAAPVPAPSAPEPVPELGLGKAGNGGAPRTRLPDPVREAAAVAKRARKGALWARNMERTAAGRKSGAGVSPYCGARFVLIGGGA